MTDKETEITTPAALVAWAGYHRPEMEETEDSVDFSEHKEYFDSLAADSEMLDGLFDRTIYGNKKDGASEEKPEASEEKTVSGILLTAGRR